MQSGGFQLAVAFRVDLLLTPRQHILRRDVADGTVQADVVVMLHVALDQTPCIFQRKRRFRPNALAFQRFVPALNLAVRLFRIWLSLVRYVPGRGSTVADEAGVIRHPTGRCERLSV